VASGLLGTVWRRFIVVLLFVANVLRAVLFTPGVEPEDVGIGKMELLSQALSGPAFFVAIFAIFYWITIVFLIILSRVSYIPVHRNRDRRFHVRLKRPPRKERPVPVIPVIGILIGILLIMVFGRMFWCAKILASNTIKYGVSAQPPEVEIPVMNIRVPLMQIRALPFRLESMNNGTIPAALAATDCMLYLGQRDSIAVVYDVKKQQVIRFKRDDFVLTTINTSQLPPDCSPA